MSGRGVRDGIATSGTMIREPTAAARATTTRQAMIRAWPATLSGPNRLSLSGTRAPAPARRSAQTAPMTVEVAASQATQARLLTQTVALLPVGCQEMIPSP
ncbi:hypothetical protein GCM10020218_031960 [Dactylosporangium vinaceum]